MCIYRSYFEKNNTIIYNSSINTAKNQVTEIVYGNDPNIYSRFIFKLNLDNLIDKITKQEITEDQIVSHKLNIYNTINELNQYIGSEIEYNINRKRASSFELILFEITEDWDEGSGYDISFNKLILNKPKNISPSNWFYKKTNEEWDTTGIYDENTVLNIISTISFDNGDENINVDITEYVNNILYNQYENNGIGIAFREDIEQLTDSKLNSVAFHTKYTSTIFEPNLETVFDIVIKDDRNNFKLDQLNRLYLYAKRGQEFFDITPIDVKIYNHKYELIETIHANNIKKQLKGIYYIELELDSDTNIDSVIYNDEWTYEINNIEKNIENEFYLIDNNTNSFIESMQRKNNINVTISGLLQDQKIKRGEQIILDLIIKKLYNQNNTEPYNFKYRIYIPQSNRTELEIIPFTEVNRAPNKYFIILDTTIFIPQKYVLELKLNNIDYNLNFDNINFTVVN
jgi:hypothetical protein